MKQVLYYDYNVVDIDHNFYGFTSERKLTLGGISKQIGVGSERIAEAYCYEVSKQEVYYDLRGCNHEK